MTQQRDFFKEWQEKRRREQALQETANSVQDSDLEDDSPSTPDPAELPEQFEWTEERELAIQRFLETTAPGTLATVHQQILAITSGLQHKNLDQQQALPLIAEVELYLDQKIRQEEAKVPIASELIIDARQDKLNALYAWEEACGALREYLAKDQAMQLEVAQYAADQGGAFLSSARRQLLDAEPFEGDGAE